MKKNLYVIVYPNDPNYKGMDKYYVSIRKQSSLAEDAHIFFGKKQVADGMKKAIKKVKGHLEPEVRKLELVKEIGK